MANAQIRRMAVVDAGDRLVGILSIGDIAAKSPGDEQDVALSLGDISSPAEPDRPGAPNARSQTKTQSRDQAG